jgi:hypothetical protein
VVALDGGTWLSDQFKVALVADPITNEMSKARLVFSFRIKALKIL